MPQSQAGSPFPAHPAAYRRARRRRRWLAGLAVLAAALLLPLAVSRHVAAVGGRHIAADPGAVPPAQVALVLGGGVYPDGTVSPMLADRLEVGLRLYRAGKVGRLLLSGDHGRRGYDEVSAMAAYVERRGIPPEDVFLDHAGFSTYESVYRAREVFGVESAIIVTQGFHLPRALYIAGALGVPATGVASDLRPYLASSWHEWREVAARNKAFLQAGLFQPPPTFLGDPIPITGDGRVTRD